MRIDDLIDSLFKDVVKPPSVDANSPGEMVRAQLAGQMPGQVAAPRPIAGAPVAPVARSPLPAPMGAGVASAAPTAAPAPAPLRLNPLGSLARGYSSGGLIGGIANMFDEPAMLERQQQEKTRTEQQAQAQQNQTVQAILSRDPSITPQQAAVIARDPNMLREVFKPKESPQPKYERIGDRLVQIGPDGVKEVYAAPTTGVDVERLTKGAGDGMMWKDPNNPSLGVVPIPGATPQKPKSVGQEALDKTFAKEYAETFIGGAFADAKKNLNAVREVAKQLEDPNGPNLSGGGFALLPDMVQDVVTPTAAAARQNVEEVVQRNLRVILGAQFTNEEGKRLIARAYNINQPEAENAKRLKRLTNAMEAMLEAKKKAAEYFEENNGSLAGFKGTAMFSAADIEAAMDDPKYDGSGAPKDKAAQADAIRKAMRGQQ